MAAADPQCAQVRIKRVPPDSTPQQIKMLMENVTGEQVMDVAIAADHSGAMALLVKRGRLLRKRTRLSRQMEALQAQLEAGGSSASQRVKAKLDKRQRAVEAVDHALDLLHDLWQTRVNV